VRVAALPSPVDLLDLPFLRTALAELGLLAVAGGLLGAWIVLRQLAFFSHAAGTATFPGLVVAEAAGISPHAAALAVALGYAGGLDRARRSGHAPSDALTGLLLVAALGTGVILASDVFHSGAAVDRLLFGTLLGLDSTDLAVSAAVALLAVAGTVALGRAWTALGFDPESGVILGSRARTADLLLLAVVALGVVAAIPAVGALLVTSLFVVPAATARLVTTSVRGLLGCSLALAAGQAAIGLYVAYWLDVPPGPAVAVLGSGVFAAVAIAQALPRWSR
jgi:ABC-type Mn2+/Zn2+ transport system permease subunit